MDIATAPMLVDINVGGKAIKAVCVVHNETSTGCVTDIAATAAIAHAAGALLWNNGAFRVTEVTTDLYGGRATTPRADMWSCASTITARPGSDRNSWRRSRREPTRRWASD